MKANELRIGNLIYDCTNATGSCNEVAVTWKYLRAIEEGWYNCKPIPLTEEWLLKVGFEYSALYENYRIAYHSEFTYYHSVRIRYGKFFYSNDYSDADCYVIRDIEYVHQLQNLHFALTGEELEIK